MFKNKNGFIILENLIALSIVALISSIVASIFLTSIFCINKFKTKQQMINIAKSEINKMNSYDLYEKELHDEYIVVDGYEVQRKFTKIIEYYNCYKISVLVNSEKDKIEIESYMVKN